MLIIWVWCILFNSSCWCLVMRVTHSHSAQKGWRGSRVRWIQSLGRFVKTFVILTKHWKFLMIWIKCRGSSPLVNVDKEGVRGCRKQTHLSFHLLSLKPRRPSSFSGVLRGTQKGDPCVSPMPTGERKHFGVRETPKESVQLSVQAEATEKSSSFWIPQLPGLNT